MKIWLTVDYQRLQLKSIKQFAQMLNGVGTDPDILIYFILHY